MCRWSTIFSHLVFISKTFVFLFSKSVIQYLKKKIWMHCTNSIILYLLLNYCFKALKNRWYCTTFCQILYKIMISDLISSVIWHFIFNSFINDRMFVEVYSWLYLFAVILKWIKTVCIVIACCDVNGEWKVFCER